jgi:hypothetical protein
MMTVLRKSWLLGVLAFSSVALGEPPHAGRSTASQPPKSNVQRPQVIQTPPVTGNRNNRGAHDGHSEVPNSPPVRRGPPDYTEADEARDVQAYEQDLNSLAADLQQVLDGVQMPPPATGEIRRSINAIDYPVDRSEILQGDTDSETF